MVAVPNFLAKRASLTPHRVAIETDCQKLTFEQLHNKALKLAAKLSSIGMKKGDAVSIFMKNSLQLVELLFGLKHLGVVTVLHNLRLTTEELSFQVEDANSKYLITEEENVEALSKTLSTIKQGRVLSLDRAAGFVGVSFPLKEEFDLDDLDTIMYTSGTTGFPKGVRQTYGNHFWSATGSALNLGLYEEDCWLLAVPLFHISGLSILMRSVVYGMRVVLHEKFEAKKVNKDLIEKGVTIVSVVSAMLHAMLEDLGPRSYPASLRCMLVGGGPVPRSILEWCQTKSIPVYQTYGMTETCSQIVTLSPDVALSKIGSAGKPLFPCQLKIIEDGNEVPANHPGEIAVKGPNVTPGYFNREEATAHAIRDGWLYTGDVGYLDNEGFLFVLDRRNDLIISGGENVYPAEVESAFLSHPLIKEAGVTGIEDERWGQVPIAFLVKRNSDITEDTMLAFAAEKLASFKVPKSVVFVKQLPRNAAGKVMRRDLLKLLPDWETKYEN